MAWRKFEGYASIGSVLFLYVREEGGNLDCTERGRVEFLFLGAVEEYLLSGDSLRQEYSFLYTFWHLLGQRNRLWFREILWEKNLFSDMVVTGVSC